MNLNTKKGEVQEILMSVLTNISNEDNNTGSISLRQEKMDANRKVNKKKKGDVKKVKVK